VNGRTFRTDKRNGKFLGVCAGIARLTGIDATFIRIGAVVLTLVGGFPWTFLAYAGAAWFGKARTSSYDEGSALPRASVRDINMVMRDADRRMAEIETHLASPNTRLAREIEALR
jgi:phage shock protein C